MNWAISWPPANGDWSSSGFRSVLVRKFSVGRENGVEYRLSAIPFGGYAALPQLVDMGRLEGPKAKTGNGQTSCRQGRVGRGKRGERAKLREETLPKITYTDKMIVSVMGAVFNVLLALVLSCILGIFGYDAADSQLTTKIGFVPDTIERWNPHVEKGEQIAAPAKRPGFWRVTASNPSMESKWKTSCKFKASSLPARA